MIVYKTASQSGDNAIYDDMQQYIDEHTPNEAHKIIDTDKVEELRGVGLLKVVDGWGNQNLVVNGRKLTITQFFRKYRY